MIFDSGVQAYVIGRATVTASFPVNWHGEPCVKCELCKFYSRSGRRCHLNGGIIPYPEKYIGPECPLNFEEENT